MKTITAVFLYWKSVSPDAQLPKWRQMLEMGLLYVLRGIGPGYYVQSRWGRRSIPFRDKWEHMNRQEYQRFIARWNPRPYQKASQHKLVEKATISLQNFPTPRFIAFTHSVRGRTAQGAPLCNASQLRSLLSAHLGKRLCFKRAEGYGGWGFQSYLIQQAESDVSLHDPFHAKTLTPEDWWRQFGSDSDGFLMEEYLEQHPDIAAINPTSVNTARLWVILTDKECDVVGGYFRVGRNSSQVDNTSSGGLMGTLNPKTGRVGGLFDPLQSMIEVPMHPDSKVVVRNFQLPHWDAVTRLAREAIKAFPRIGVVGLDIAFGPSGPVLIELNVCPDYIGCAWMDMPLKQLDRRMVAPAGASA